MSSRIKELLLKFGAAFMFESEQEVIAFVRAYMVTKLKSTKPEELADAIKNDFNLLPAIDLHTKRALLQRAMQNKIVKKLVDKEKAKIDCNLVLQWLKIDRPDLYSVVINYPEKKGITWLEIQTEKIKQELFA